MKNTNDKKNKSTGIQNPANTIQGKILIWVLILLMVGGSLFGLIFALADLLF